MNDFEVKITPKNATQFDFSEIWQFRELVYYLARRDIKVKYSQTFLGIIWVALQPLLLMAVFYLVFFRSFKISDNVNYPVYVFAGLVLWGLFSSGITNSCDNMINSAQIIKKIYFPRLIIPLASFATALVDFFVAFLLLIILLFIFHQPLSISFIYCFPLALILVFIASFGIASMLSALSVKFRDFRYIIPFGMQFLFFSSQIIYSIRSLRESPIRILFYCNPLNGALELFYHPMNNIPLYIPGIILSLVFAALFFITGILYFKRTEIYFADII